MEFNFMSVQIKQRLKPSYKVATFLWAIPWLMANHPVTKF